MSHLLEDGNIVGRIGALALIIAAGFGLHRLSCGSGTMCPMMRTDSCCAGAMAQPKAEAPQAAPAAVPSPAK